MSQRVRACVSTRTLRDTGAILRVVRPCTSGYTFEPSCTTLQGAGAAELGVQLRPPQVRRVHLGKILVEFCVLSRKKTDLKFEATKICRNFKDIVNPENAAPKKKFAKKFDKN